MSDPSGAEAASPSPGEDRRPSSVWQLAWVFNRLALQGFGGVLPVAQRELVEREQWLSREEFLALVSLGQVLPGPNIVNMAFIFGQQHFGVRGALAALTGLMAAPLVVVMALAVLFREFGTQPQVAGALRGMGVVAAGLIVSTACKLGSTLRRSVLGLQTAGALVVATFASVGLMRWPLVAVVVVLGPLGLALAWRQLGGGRQAPRS